MQKMSLSLTLVLVCFYFSFTNGQNEELQKLLSEGSLSFAVNLISNLHQRAGAGENLIISPINIYAVLAMVHLGSSGATRDSLADILGFPREENRVPDVHEALGEILRRLQGKGILLPPNRSGYLDQFGLDIPYVSGLPESESRTNVAMANDLFAKKDHPFVTSYIDQVKKYFDSAPTNVDLSSNPKDIPNVSGLPESESRTNVAIANGLFAKKDYPFLTSYIDQVKKYYDSAPTNVDFSSNPKDATDLINKWASDSTKGRIQQLYALPLSPSTEMVLAGTLYFKGKWESNFDKYLTKPEKFNTGVKDMEVQMMHNIKYLPYINNPKLKFEAIHLPYLGNEYTMTIILPYESQNLKNLIQNMNSEVLQKVFDNSEYERVECKIPRMKFSWNNSLVETLSMQGMENIFQNADLRNMISENNLLISDLTHAAEIEVDEFGTVASAATASMLACSASMNPPDPVPFFVNRPFIAAIYHEPTKTTLFMAVVHQPTLSNS